MPPGLPPENWISVAMVTSSNPHPAPSSQRTGAPCQRLAGATPFTETI